VGEEDTLVILLLTFFAKLKFEDKDYFLSGSRIKSSEKSKLSLFLIYAQSTAECIDFKNMVTKVYLKHLDNVKDLEDCPMVSFFKGSNLKQLLAKKSPPGIFRVPVCMRLCFSAASEVPKLDLQVYYRYMYPSGIIVLAVNISFIRGPYGSTCY